MDAASRNQQMNPTPNPDYGMNLGMNYGTVGKEVENPSVVNMRRNTTNIAA